MLPDRIVKLWKDQVDVNKHVQSSHSALSSNELQNYLLTFRHVISLSPEDVRRKLSEMDPEYNRKLAWTMLGNAIKQYAFEAPSYLQRIVEWTEVIAEYSDPSRHLQDALEAHCEFYLGVLHHVTENMEKARANYMKAETAYRDAGSNKLLLGINIYAEGHLSLELQNVGGDGKSYGPAEMATIIIE